MYICLIVLAFPMLFAQTQVRWCCESAAVVWDDRDIAILPDADPRETSACNSSVRQ